MDVATETDFIDMLRGAELPPLPVWPPTEIGAYHLEKWMTISANGPYQTILQSGAMDDATSLLDVGGGDGTIAIGLVKAYPELKATVFNLKGSADQARVNIDTNFLEDKVKVAEGNFLTDELNPNGEKYDRIMFSRVLTDWTPKVVTMLIQKVRRALAPGGKLIINEAFYEGNEDMCISWEFRYIHVTLTLTLTLSINSNYQS